MNKIKPKGFTLVELIMCVAIMTLMTSVMFYNYPDSSTRINLASLSSKISLLIREAQVRGSAIDSGVGSIISGYGLYFDSLNLNQVILFNDFTTGGAFAPNGILVGNGVYDAPTEKNSITTFMNGFKISKLCTGSGFPVSLTLDPNACVTNSLDISFTRPDPKAQIYKNQNTSVNAACIELVSSKYPKPGHIRSVQVFNSGRIITSNTGCSIP